MSSSKLNFWISVIEKLNVNTDPHEPLLEVMKELCDFFGFGCAFIFKANQKRIFEAQESYSAYENSYLIEPIDVEKAIGQELIEEFTESPVVVYLEEENATVLAKKLASIFAVSFLTIMPIIDQEGKVAAFVGFVDRRNSSNFHPEDLSIANAVLGAIANRVKLRIFQERMQDAQNAMDRMLDNMGFDVYVNDFYTHEVLYVNESMARPYGGPENMIGKKCYLAIYEDKTRPCEYCPQKRLIDEDGNPTKVYSWDYQRPFDGAWFRVISAAFPWTDGRLAHVVSSVDITENKKNEEIIRQIAELDALTDIRNRRKMIIELEKLTKQIKQGTKEKFYLLFFDVNDLKFVNDKYGHVEGDNLLKAVADSLQKHPLTRNNAYRYGGDEFVVILADPSDEDLRSTVNYVKCEMGQGYSSKGKNENYSASVGVAQYPKDSANIDDLIHFADAAMYKAKFAKGENVAYFYNKGDMVPSTDYFEKL